MERYSTCVENVNLQLYFKLVANGKHHCNSSPICYLNPCLFCDSFCWRVPFADSDCFWKTKKMFQIVTVLISDLNETGKVMSLVERPWVEDAVRQSHRYCNLLNQPSSAFSKLFLFVKLAALCYCGPTEHVPILLRAIALRDSTCSESTLLNALKQDDIFFICLLVIFSWFCYVAG